MMDPTVFDPYGKALLDFLQGHTAAALLSRREDGHLSEIPVRYFFREVDDFTPIDRLALKLCEGRVLDIGAGTGIHSLALQKRGLEVIALDVSPHAVKIIQQHGVRNVYCADIFEFKEGSFDTLLMMGHGIGIVKNLSGLDRFLVHAHDLLTSNGQVLLDSLDVRHTDDPQHLAYHAANRRAGRYIGEIRMQLEFLGERGDFFYWLHVDPETLAEHAGRAGWKLELLFQGESGDYLARLERLDAMKI